MLGKRGFWFSCKDFFACHKWHIIFLSAIVIFGACIGAITVNKFTKVFSIEDITDVLIVDVVKGNRNFFYHFFSKLFFCIFCMGIIYLVCLNFFTSFISVIFIFYRAYLIGLNVTIITLIYGVGGAINLIIFYIPIQLCFIFVLVLFASLNMRNAKLIRHHNHSQNVLSFALIFIIMFSIVSFAEAILLPNIIKNFLIVV